MLAIKGLFKMADSEGIPLTNTLVLCTERGVRPDWADFFREAHAAHKRDPAGKAWTHEKVCTYISEALADSGYPQTLAEVLREAHAAALTELAPHLTESEGAS